VRILNAERLASHGNRSGRSDILKILEAGLEAADPYNSARKLLKVEGRRLIVGNADFEPRGSPRSGAEIFDLDKVGKILVVGAGKGVHRVAKAIEDVLGDRLAGGQIIVKHGDEANLERVGVTYGGHPVPDEGCVQGCMRILELCRGLRPEDLVFTIAANGISSLLTLPAPGITLEEVRQATYLMQIERGVPTQELNAVRNHLDQLKGGLITRYLQPASAIHLLAYDPLDYRSLLYDNFWMHTLPDFSTFADGVAMLKKWDVWNAVPESIRRHLLRADSAYETVKAEEFVQSRFRIFGLMPRRLGIIPTAQRRAAELGYVPHTLCSRLQAEASQAGLVVADIAKSIETLGVPFTPPCVMVTGGELLVTVGRETGIGGRNQEYALSAALRIAGSRNITMAAVDTDGTDGPGGQFVADGGLIPTLAGGIVDGQTVAEAAAAGVDLFAALSRHDSTPALWQLDCGILATHNVSVGDLAVTLIGK
jgi:glycerate 2-kinase